MAYVGDTVRLKCHFRTFNGNSVEPTNVTLTIYDDQKQIIENINLDDTNKLDVGVYFYDYVIPDGNSDLVYEFAGTYNNKPILARGEIKVKWIY